MAKRSNKTTWDGASPQATISSKPADEDTPLVSPTVGQRDRVGPAVDIQRGSDPRYKSCIDLSDAVAKRLLIQLHQTLKLPDEALRVLSDRVTSSGVDEVGDERNRI